MRWAVAIAATLVFGGSLFAGVAYVLRVHGIGRTDWCDHERLSTYVGHVAVDLADGRPGIAPAHRCPDCLREWLGAAEPMRRPLADVAIARRSAL